MSSRGVIMFASHQRDASDDQFYRRENPKTAAGARALQLTYFIGNVTLQPDGTNPAPSSGR